MKKNVKITLTAIIAIIAIGALAWFISTKKDSSKVVIQEVIPPVNNNEIIPENKVVLVNIDSSDPYVKIDPTLRDVEFCGVNYKSQQVFIHGVDVMQRIAQALHETALEKNMAGKPKGSEKYTEAEPIREWVCGYINGGTVARDELEPGEEISIKIQKFTDTTVENFGVKFNYSVFISISKNPSTGGIKYYAYPEKNELTAPNEYQTFVWPLRK